MNMPSVRHRRKLHIILPVAGVLLIAGGYLIYTKPTASPSNPVASDHKPSTQPGLITVKLPGAKPFPALKEDYTLPDSLWTLVNKNRTIPLDYTPQGLLLAPVATRADKSTEERSVRPELATPLKRMFADAKTSGHELMIGSAYRSSSLQKTYFDHYAKVAGEEAANRYSAHPGESEHQTGLSVDITSTSLACYLEECFADIADGKWLADNAYKYGFTLRYPKGKENVTGYQFEPWHYRYVGIDLATALYESELTLDEAWLQLETVLKALKQSGAI